MKSFLSLSLTLLLSFSAIYGYSQCSANEKEVIVLISPDQFPNETSWDIVDPDNNLIASGGATSDTICVADTVCLIFTIYDSYGDGIFSPGGYSLYYDNVLVIQRTGYNFGDSEYWHMGCYPGFSCQSPLQISEGNHTAPNAETWYSFTPDSVGTYIIQTCDSNACNTMLWVYDNCIGINVTEGVEGAAYWGDNECGQNSRLNTILDAGTEYFIRVGDSLGACGNSPIQFSIQYMGQVTGCTDPTACNYEPLATISDTCIYAPNPNCPAGPDLIIDRNAVLGSIFLDQINNVDNCQVIEGCVTGMGTRNVLKFTTHIKNIGNQDYYIGSPAAAPHLFDNNNCHGHAHYLGYADYVLFDDNGLEIPVGFKSGFCVMDVTCTNGGQAKFSCSNMGISAGCDDIYGSSTTCNWIDVTDVDTGRYTLVLRTNWDQRPDAAGRHEVDYDNNWTQVCIKLSYNTSGNLVFALRTDCPVFVDCAGDTLGSSQFDCMGVCNGGNLTGDINSDTIIDGSDVTAYLNGILNSSLTPTACNDLNIDGNLDVTDVALANRCSLPYGNPSKCEFPAGFLSSNDTARFKIVNVNWNSQYLDVAMINPTSEVLGYQLKFSGITISNASNLASATEFPVSPSFLVGGDQVIHLALNDSLINRNFSYQNVLRVFWSAMTDTVICISDVVGVLNKDYENIIGVASLACIENDGIPLNNLCINAVPITCGETAYGNNINSTSAGTPASCLTAIHGNGVWYQITGTGDQFTINSCNASTDFNTIIEVYSGSCGNFTCIAGNDDNQACSDTSTSKVVFTSNLATIYYIYVSGDNVSGNFGIAINCLDLCPDPSDLNISSITDTSASIDWSSANTSTFNVEVVLAGQTPGIGNNVIPVITGATGVDGPPVAANGLMEGTSYDVYVYDDCGGGNISAQIGPDNFNTLFGVPGNDLCVNAIPIFCENVYIGSTSQATSIDLPSTCGTSVTGKGIWYTMTGIDGSITIKTCGGITNYDTKLHVYSGSCGSFTCVTGNDDNCNLQSSVTFTSILGTNYFIYVSGYSNNSGDFSLDVSCTYTSPPSEPNDSCMNAIAINCGDTLSGSTANATISQGGTCGPPITSPGVWYTHNGTGLNATVSTCGMASFDTRISVFTGTCGSLTCVGGNDDYNGCGTNTSQYTFGTNLGTQYYILVHGFQNAVGNFDLILSCDTPCAPIAANDVCSSAIPLAVSEVGACTYTSGNNICASSTSTNPVCDPFGNIQDVWYSFNTGSETSVNINVTNITASGLSMAVYDTCGGSSLYCNSNASVNAAITNLIANKTYYIQLWNTGGAAEGGFDICVSKMAPICAKPANVFTTNMKPTGITLNWDAVSGATGYTVRGRLINNPTYPFVYINLNGSTTSYTASNIKMNSDFEWQVRTICASGTSDWTDLDTFSTVCQVPVSWTENITATTAKLRWTASPHTLGYIIEGSEMGSSTVITLPITGGTKDFYNASGLGNNTTYVWRIAPVCKLPLGTLNYSTIDTFTTPNTGSSQTYSNTNFKMMKIHPNPADDLVNIVMYKPHSKKLGKIILHDMQGRALFELEEESYKYRYTISTSELPNGVYYVSYESEEHQGIMQRLIISR
ncbi:MAG: T9SS type A sorting domain-containing protein [Chitinophagales bacterium]|nr:T9SS type A sorting domain-containing protein [Chitinophagales bacterium]